MLSSTPPAAVGPDKFALGLLSPSRPLRRPPCREVVSLRYGSMPATPSARPLHAPATQTDTPLFTPLQRAPGPPADLLGP